MREFSPAEDDFHTIRTLTAPTKVTAVTEADDYDFMYVDDGIDMTMDYQTTIIH